MANGTTTHQVPPEVAFIENHLPLYHSTFQRISSYVHYDEQKRQYILKREPVQSMAAQRSPNPQIEAEPLPLITVDDSAAGFSKVMDVLMVKVPTEPKGGSVKGYSIRYMTSWEGVLEVMDRAAAEHASKTGAKGTARILGNFIGNKADPAKRITAAIPDVGYTKPIVGTLNFLLDVRRYSYLINTWGCRIFEADVVARTGFSKGWQGSH